MFLTSEQVARLTGIHTGRGGKHRWELQAAQLKIQHIRFWVNAKGEPIVPLTEIGGGKQKRRMMNGSRLHCDIKRRGIDYVDHGPETNQKP